MLEMAARAHGISRAISTIRSINQFGGDAGWTVAPAMEYAVYQEYGTSRMPAQPFMRPAARTVQARVGVHVAQANSMADATRRAALDVESEAKSLAPVDTGALRASIQARPR